jgi:hypothetical protein
MRYAAWRWTFFYRFGMKTNMCGGGGPNFRVENLGEFETEFQNILG